MEGLHCLEFLLEQDDLLCKLDLKEAYFSVPLNKNSQKFVRSQWSDNLYEFRCLCFGLWSAPRIFTIIKSFNRPLQTRQHSNLYLPRRYVANVVDVTRNSHCKRHIDFSITTFGFCDQPQKITSSSCETNRVSGLNNRYRENDFGSFREKIKTCVSTMSGDFHATKNSGLKSHKVN